MSRLVLCLIVLSLSVITPFVQAQTAELAVPQLVVKDADGKVIGQVAGFNQPSTNFWPLVILDVEGTPAILVFQPYGLIDRVAAGIANGATVFYSGSDCTGSPYVNQVGGLEASIGTHFGVGGPDATLGTYKLYRSTTLAVSVVMLSSKWVGGECVNYGPQSTGVLPAEEVIPNPLAGFHGPTTAQPDRLLTVSGGDRLQ